MPFGAVPIIPLKHLVKLYQKYMPESEIHLAEKVDPRRDTFYAKDTSKYILVVFV